MNKTKHITQEGGGMNENGTGVPGTEVPFPKGSWQHAVDDELVNFGRTSQEFATPHEAVQWLITETIECARTSGVNPCDAMPAEVAEQYGFFRRVATDHAYYADRLDKLAAWLETRLAHGVKTCDGGQR